MNKLNGLTIQAYNHVKHKVFTIKKDGFDGRLIESAAYFPDEIREKALFLKWVFTTEFHLADVSLNVRYITDDANGAAFKEMLVGSQCIINVLSSLKPCPRRYLYMTLIDIDLPKKVRWADIPTSMNVNTGFTAGDTIYVYRREEMMKVIIHELVHFWEFKLHDYYNSELTDYFGVVSTPINFNEGYVDSIAMVLNVALVCAKRGLNFKITWRKEFQHVMNQAVCVSANQWACEHNYEKTNTMSYYVVKAALYCAGSTYWSLLRRYNYNLNNMIGVNAFYNILKHELTTEDSRFWKSMKLAHAKRGLCISGDTMKMSSVI